MQQVQSLLFDLDGTLTDSAAGIFLAYKYAFFKMEVGIPSDEALMGFIGRPIRQNIIQYVPSNKVEECVSHYYYFYDYMRFGLTENKVYPGVVDMLADLSALNIDMYIVSGKLHDLIYPILNLFELEPYFKKVYGASPDVSASDKTDIIAYAMMCERLDPVTTIVVGDRSYDVNSARVNGLRSVAVTWGYGSERELVECRPDYIIHEPSQLVALASHKKMASAYS